VRRSDVLAGIGVSFLIGRALGLAVVASLAFMMGIFTIAMVRLLGVDG
jgi:hypothetical protein